MLQLTLVGAAVNLRLGGLQKGRAPARAEEEPMDQRRQHSKRDSGDDDQHES